jgi:DNA-binding PadR family transcriptional regulator
MVSRMKNESREVTRELTTLEYIILGFLAVKPQSGYAIINSLETGTFRASASTGSIYPVLKRLEQAGIISSTLEAEHELRPRKVYSVLPLGGQLLDSWLRRPPTMSEVIEEYDIAMHKFLIAAYRLGRADILAWLNDYETIVQSARVIRAAMDDATRDDPNLSLHIKLVNLSLALEMDARLTWIQTAKEQLSATDRSTHNNA